MSSPIGNESITQISGTFEIQNGDTAGIIFRFQDNDNHLALLIRDASTDTVRVFNYTSAYSELSSYDFVPPVDNLYAITLEFNDSEIRYQVNSEPVQTLNNTDFASNRQTGVRFGNTQQRCLDYESRALTAFTL